MQPARIVSSLAVIIVAATGASACADSAKPQASGSNGAGPCVAGDPVGDVPGSQLPACARFEPADSTYVYACRSSAPDNFYIVYLPTSTLYGKPGGTWKQGAASATFTDIRRAALC